MTNVKLNIWFRSCRQKGNIKTDNEIVCCEEVGLSEDDNESSADIKVKFYISMP